MDFEAALDKFEELRASEGQTLFGDRNEATTRLHLVDSLIFDCLGWDRRECITEESLEGLYADYTLGSPIRFAIWEAKREGVSFTLPAGFSKRTCKIKTLLETEGGIADAIQQVLGYCQQRGVAVGVVCNGHQVVAFLASRTDNVAPLAGQALIFSSLDDIRADFKIFWDNLSRPGAESYNLHKILRSELLPPPPEKLSQRILKYPGFKNRNQFQSELKNLGELFIEDLGKTPEQEEEFLRSCYSTSGALSQYALISRQILQSKYPESQQKEMQIDRIESVADKKGTNPAISEEVFAAAMTRRPVIIMGDVGVGKTSFLRHLIKVDAKAVLARSIVIYADFGKEPALSKDLETFFRNKSESQLRHTYGIDIDQDGFVRGVYHSELARFTKGIYGSLRESSPNVYAQKELEFLDERLKDRERHLLHSFEHISKGQKRQIVVFLDNIDQRPVEFQEQVFLIAHSLAETWPVTTFVSLRPDTFYHSRVKGTLAAYQPRVFTVSPPRLDTVIIRRFEYALAQLEGTGKLETIRGFSVESHTLIQYLRALLNSFNNSSALMEFIDNLSGGNVREALTFVEAFVGSGHVDAQKIISKSQMKDYRIPIHEFMRAVIYGDYEYFDAGSSPICNLFDVSTHDGREHFLLPNLLALVERQGSADEGFVDAQTLFNFAQDLGFQPAQVHFALDRSLSKRLIETNPKFTANPKSVAYRITSVGAYSLQRLMRTFVYLDAVVVDTPILDSSARSLIVDTDDIVSRLQRGTHFLNYLDSQSKKLAERNVAFDWGSCATNLEREIRAIAVRQQGRPARHHV